MNEVKSFLNTIFDGGQSTCFASFPQETRISSINSPPQDAQWFSINSLKNSRADANVETFRNILCEYDKISIEEQLSIIEKSQVPHTALVFSGNSSVHCIISLETPCSSAEEYACLVSRVYSKLPGVDVKCKNPSRLARLPGTIRPDTGQLQKLLSLKSRVPNSVLEDWAGPRPVDTFKITSLALESGFKKIPNVMTRRFLLEGAEPGNRNPALFSAACELFRCGYSVDEVFEAVYNKTTLSHKEVKAAIYSAKRTTGK